MYILKHNIPDTALTHDTYIANIYRHWVTLNIDVKGIEKMFPEPIYKHEYKVP